MTGEQQSVKLNFADIMPKQTKDRTITFFDSVTEGIEFYQIQGDAVKIIAYKYGEMKEFPALAYLSEEQVYVAPLMRGEIIFSFPVKEIEAAKEIVSEELNFEKIENEFLELGISKINKDFENLFPEYEFDGSNAHVIVYDLPCGLRLTQNSFKEIKNG